MHHYTHDYPDGMLTPEAHGDIAEAERNEMLDDFITQVERDRDGAIFVIMPKTGGAQWISSDLVVAGSEVEEVLQ